MREMTRIVERLSCKLEGFENFRMSIDKLRKHSSRTYVLVLLSLLRNRVNKIPHAYAQRHYESCNGSFGVAGRLCRCRSMGRREPDPGGDGGVIDRFTTRSGLCSLFISVRYIDYQLRIGFALWIVAVSC